MARQPSLKFTCSGIFSEFPSGTAEIWSMGFHLGNASDTAYSQTELNDLNVADVYSIITGWFSSAAMQISTGCLLTMIKIAGIGADGKYGALNAVFSEVNVAGHGGGTNHPTTTSVAVSLRSFVRGPKGRGRFYIPGVTNAVQNDWHFPSSDMQSMANSTGAMLKALVTEVNSLIGTTHDVGLIVASSVEGNVPVTTVECGTVPDNISRRKNKMVDVYEVATTYP